MQRLVINKFGPIEYCDIEIKDFMVFTGAQASGKSTVVKCIFFFNNLKNILYQLVTKNQLQHDEDTVLKMSLAKRFFKEIRNNFLQIFGTTLAMNPAMHLSYTFDNGETVEISLKSSPDLSNFAYVQINPTFRDKIDELERRASFVSVMELPDYKSIIEKELFDNEMEIVYIPAGRSLITLLSTQINYLYSTMDDLQKRSIDYCTQNYLERILQLKSFYSTGLRQLVGEYKSTTDKIIDNALIKQAIELNKRILKGEYRNISGEERLQISDDHYVKINFASSGQQEAVWILNVLFYYMLNNRKAYFIIEEPESHLFPNAQKLMMEYIALTQNHSNRIAITTHSPYVLGSINNLLYAHKLSRNVDRNELNSLISEYCWIPFEKIGAYYLENGLVNGCTDPDYDNIQNDIIDGASDEINDLFEKMVDLKREERND